MPDHSPGQLALANACHPALPAAERRRVLLAVARAHGDHAWVRRLRPRQKGVEAATAMAMLDDYEHRRSRRTGSGAWPPLTPSGLPPILLLLLVVLLVGLLAGAGRPR